jgi:uncharacterized protein YneF (UPF0154 family)
MNITVLAGFITGTILSISNFLSQLRTSVAIRHPSMTKTKLSVMYASMALEIFEQVKLLMQPPEVL